MNEAARGDIKIAGAGTVATGAYRAVNIAGSAVLTGDIECATLKVAGAVEGEGTLHAESVTVNGSFGYRGVAEFGKMRVNGTATCDSLTVDELHIAGTLDTRELTVNRVTVQGFLNVANDCEAERFVTQGAFTVGGLLNAGVVDIVLGGKCSASEVGGEAVAVRTNMGALKRFVTSLIPGMEVSLTVGSIEADDIRLERTTASAVRGNTVVIGPECVIGLVEYSGSYSASPDAQVREVRRLDETASAQPTPSEETPTPQA